MRPCLRLLCTVPVLAATAGCAATQGARYVYQDGEYGVVGIPENTDRFPTHYRRRAEELIAAHFPEGHEIIRAEEVVEGSRTLTVQGTKTAELAPHLPKDAVAVGKLGRSTSRSQADTLKIKESRIIYRRATRPGAPAAFAEVATLTPAPYIDPNAPERRKAIDEASKQAKADEKQQAKAGAESQEWY